MAEVKMDLAELKQLEEKIKKLESEKQELINREHQVVIYHKYFTGKVKPGKPKSGIRIDSVSVMGSYYSHLGQTQDFNNICNIDKALEAGLIEIDLAEDSSRHTKDYKNMSEVISEIRAEEEAKVKALMEKTLRRATEAEYQVASIADGYEKTLLRVKNDATKKLDKIKESYEERLAVKEDVITRLKQEFSDFKEDKKRVSLEDELIKLRIELREQKNKSFWKRVFNT